MGVREFRVAAPRDEPLEHTLQQAVTKALAIIWHFRFEFTFEAKQGIGDRPEDVCSSVDHKAQEEMVSTLRSKQLLKEYGFLCEEEGVERWTGTGPYFTVDALDGTAQFMRGNWNAVGALGAAVRDGIVESACVGALTTRDLISYGPTSSGVNHLSGEFSRHLPSASLHTGGLEASRILLRRPLHRYSPVIRQLVGETSDYLITDESLGVWMARLWKQEVRMAVLCQGSKVTPWDITPLIGISQRLGYAFLRTAHNGTRLERFVPGLPTRELVRPLDALIIHEHDLYLVRHLLVNEQ